MKKLFFLSLSLGLFSVSFAQTKTVPKATTPAVKAAAPKTTAPAKTVTKAAPTTKSTIVLKTAEDSMSYSIGVLDGNFFKSQGIEKINAAVLASGFADALKGKPLFTPEQCDMIVRTPTGLQYEVITEGTGPKPADTSVVKVHYEGFLLNGNGRPFDSSRERGEPTQFPLNQVIRGWTEGVQLMGVGSKYKFYIPYQLAYGEQGSGETIPGGSLLIFEVELIDIVKGQN